MHSLFSLHFFVASSKFPLTDSKSEYKPTIGEEFWSIGNPLGHPGVMTQYTYKRTEGPGDSTYVFLGYAPPGQSGAPIFNDRGEVIAMVVTYDEEKQEVYALPSFLF